MQGIGTETADLEALVAGDVRIAFQQLGDSAEDGPLDAIGVERLE